MLRCTCFAQDKASATRELQQLQGAMSDAKRQMQAAEAGTARARSQLTSLKHEAADAEAAKERALRAQQMSGEVGA